MIHHLSMGRTIDVEELRIAAADIHIRIGALAKKFNVCVPTLYTILKLYKVEKARAKCRTNAAHLPVPSYGKIDGRHERAAELKPIGEWPEGISFR